MVFQGDVLFQSSKRCKKGKINSIGIRIPFAEAEKSIGLVRGIFMAAVVIKNGGRTCSSRHFMEPSDLVQFCLYHLHVRSAARRHIVPLMGTDGESQWAQIAGASDAFVKMRLEGQERNRVKSYVKE